jgi:hypothetical protein
LKENKNKKSKKSLFSKKVPVETLHRSVTAMCAATTYALSGVTVRSAAVGGGLSARLQMGAVSFHFAVDAARLTDRSHRRSCSSRRP